MLKTPAGLTREKLHGTGAARQARPAGGLVLGIVLGLSACGQAGPAASALSSSAPRPASSDPSMATAVANAGTTLHGLGITPVPHKPHLVLTDTSGRPFDLVAATAGRLTYLFFGYTHCPDSCPATMADLATALRSVPFTVRQRVAVVFVTTDPRRDDRAQLRSWLDRFDPTFIGLTGTQAQIASAERSAGVPLAQPEPDGHGGYGVTHSSEVFAYSPDNLSHVVYAEGFRPSDYANDMPLLLARR